MQSSTQLNEYAREKTRYVVVSFHDEKDFKIELMTDNTQTKDALYITLQMIQSLESNGIPQNEELLTPLKVLVENHRQTKLKIAIHLMKGALGQGAFSYSAIKKDDYIIYPGVLERLNTLPADPLATISVSKEFHTKEDLQYNATYSDTPARYFQHLPDGKMVMYNGETYALSANFTPKTVYACIKLNSKCYTIPVVILIASRDIPVGELLGFDYGFDYWKDRGVPFLYLSSVGKPLTTYWLQALNKRDDKFFIMPLNIRAFTSMVCHSHIQLDDSCILLPKEGRERLDSICQSLSNEGGSRVISLPAIVSLHLMNITVADKKVFIYLDINKPFELNSSKLIKHFQITHDILHSSINPSETLSVLWFPLDTLLNSSTEMISNLRRFLLQKDIINAASFVIHVNPAMLTEVKNGITQTPVKKIELRRHKRISLFGEEKKGPLLPAPLVERIIELELSRCRFSRK